MNCVVSMEAILRCGCDAGCGAEGEDMLRVVRTGVWSDGVEVRL